MSITNDAVLKKMMKEVQEAMGKQDHASVREHVRAVKLLCDLVLDEEGSSPGNVQEPTAAELRKMMGDDTTSHKVTKSSGSERSEHGKANGDSIFDF
ncbi:YwdI family protein [Thalassobacillus hwangdonensis]|uniref:YwdI family protein n=1 Tax=Thalassobacillus hwangdonensis TaxID=546108 RepID=A0ABW3L3U7_9BACI